MGNTSLIIVYHIKKKPKYRIVFEFLNLMTLAGGLPFVLYSMKTKEQTRKLAAVCSKSCFEVTDRTDEVSSKHCFEVADRTDEVSNHTYGKATLTWFEEIFEEY